MNSRFVLGKTIYRGTRSMVLSARDRHTDKHVAIKLKHNAEREVTNMLVAVECDPRKVCALEMKRPVDMSELCLDGFPDADRIAADHRYSRAVVMALHEPPGRGPPACVCDRLAAEVMRPYFEAVAELHERSSLCAHCDVKFSNFVRPVGGAGTDRCLVDLELAAARHPGKRGTVAASGSGKRGTPLYMAPEVYLRGEVNSRVDSWALGLMLFQACHAGRMHPFFLDNKDMTRERLIRSMADAVYDEQMWTNTGAPLSAALAAELLSANPHERLTPAEALQRPLFTAPPA